MEKYKKILKKTDLRKGGGADTGKIGQLRSKLAVSLDKNKRLNSKKQESNQKIKKLKMKVNKIKGKEKEA
jgi:hypothetical protein